jgi:hypothetical protein
MLDLKALEGTNIQAIIRFINPKVRDYKLHKVEAYGIWVESQEANDSILVNANVTGASRTFVAFVPWSGVGVIYGSVGVPSLSETAFELQ